MSTNDELDQLFDRYRRRTQGSASVDAAWRGFSKRQARRRVMAMVLKTTALAVPATAVGWAVVAPSARVVEPAADEPPVEARDAVPSPPSHRATAAPTVAPPPASPQPTAEQPWAATAKAAPRLPKASPLEVEPAEETASPSSTLDQEIALLRRAESALRRGDLDVSQRALDEHARTFPAGLLVRERERLRDSVGDRRREDSN